MNDLLNDFKKITVSTLEKPNHIILNKNKNKLSKKKDNSIYYRNQKNSKKQNILSGLQNDKSKIYKLERQRARQLLREQKKENKKRRKNNASFKKKKTHQNQSKKITFCMGNNRVKEYVCTGLEEHKDITHFNSGYETDDEGHGSRPFEIREMPEINLDELFN